MCPETNFHDYVESLSTDDLLKLEKEIRYRKFRIKLGGDNFSKSNNNRTMFKSNILEYCKGSEVDFDIVDRYISSYPDIVYKNICNMG